MKNLNDLHTKAMDLMELALLEKRRKNNSKSKQLFEEAYQLERQAAMMMTSQYTIEPTRSVLFKSAACLALDIEDYREAERMIAFALSGNPPHEIVEELRGLLGEINEHESKSKRIENQVIFNQFEQLPVHLKQEAANYIGYLLQKHTTSYAQ